MLTSTQPEETDTLVLYSGGWQFNLIYTPAIGRFKELYPDVNVVLKNYSEDEFEAAIRAEIPAGRGPDVLYADTLYLPDIYKTMETRVLEDLNPYLEADDSFSLDGYIRGVMDSGLLDGRRYIMPIQQDVEILTTTAECLADAGLTADILTAHEAFCAACEQYMDERPGHSYLCTDPSSVRTFLLRHMYQFSGLRFFDYGNRTVVLDGDELKRICDVCKSYQLVKKKNSKPITDGYYFLRDCITERDSLFTDYSTPITLLSARKYLREAEEEPISFLMPDVSGGATTAIHTYAAIPVGAENKLNAWRFIKILLSEEIQNDHENSMRGVFPVLKSAFAHALQDCNEFFSFPAEEIEQLAALMDTVDQAVMLPPILWTYLRDNMMPYIAGNKEFDICFDKLMNVLELYIDE